MRRLGEPEFPSQPRFGYWPRSCTLASPYATPNKRPTACDGSWATLAGRRFDRDPAQHRIAAHAEAAQTLSVKR